VVMNPDFFQGFFELFALQVFFFGINDQFSHTLPSCIIHARYRIMGEADVTVSIRWQDLVSFTSDMLRKKDPVSIYISQIK
jgi:hypothetical protein